MKTKGLEIKIEDEAQGKVSAVFSTFNVIDSDNDVTLPGAFVDGEKVRISAYNHASWGSGFLPVGRGTIHAGDKEAVLEGEFFMETSHGRDHFATVKQMGDLQEWSYGYDVLESEPGEHEGKSVTFLKALKVHEVSPVILGAGVGTRTLAAKSRGLKLVDHIDSVITDVDGLVERVSDVVALRTEEGKRLGAEASASLARLQPSLAKLEEVLRPEAKEDDNDGVELGFALQRERFRATR